ncbi:permease [Bacillus songklensis]|uniref:Permease n=1 Tax=Bacillus songklensis TaxID=1069116 RepID=A0ABV8B9C3_9BACI
MLFVYLFFFAKQVKEFLFINQVPADFANINTIFLSIVMEAIPFILLGVFASALIQSFISEKTLQRMLPKHAFLAMLPAALLGIIFPICECAIIPVVRRLIKKGLPLHVGIVILVTVPILNPVVFLSTYFAFPHNAPVLYYRMGLAFLAAMLIGSAIYFIFKDKNIVKDSPLSHHHHTHQRNRWIQTLHHASEEFFDTGKYLIIGSFIASLFQTYLNRDILVSIGTNDSIAPAVMMGFAYVLSLCSEADAFVASSFSSTFTTGSLIAFLVLGPMIDLKNTLMLFAYFRKRFVIAFLFLIFSIVYGLVWILQAFVL